MKKYFLLISVILLLLLLLGACGSSGPTTNLRVDMTDFMYNPSNFTVPAGETITLDLTNNGAVEHNFIIMDFGTDIGNEFGDEDEANVYWQTKLGPGQSETFTFTAPSEPGEYQVVCSVQGHYQAGMVASLIVVAP
jgi:uncharacterized cupredoxin-like copper-binding protein